MPDLIFHEASKRQLDAMAREPAHAVLLTAPKGAGKGSVVRWLAAELFQSVAETITEHPYVAHIQRGKEKTIGIEAIRELEHFLSLRVPGDAVVNRIIIIEDSHLLTHEAQNALLKTLEEPPAGTVLLLTAISEQTLLPTVRSRVAHISIRTPKQSDTTTHFIGQNYEQSSVEQALTISGGLPGLMTALLQNSEHELVSAISAARELLGQTQYGRLVVVDSLSKDRELTDNVLFILQQMAEVQLRKTGAANAERWSRVLQASFEAEKSLANSGQSKLVLTNFMLNLS